MPFGEQQSQFFVPGHGRYAARLVGTPRDGKLTKYDDGSSSVPVFWPCELYNADGTPVHDPAHPERPVAIVDVRTGQSAWFTSNGDPTIGRKFLLAFAKGQGLDFGDEDLTQARIKEIIAAILGGWAWLTYGPPTNKRSKATSVVRTFEPMMGQPAKTALPVLPAAPVQVEEQAPAAPVFQQPAAQPTAPVFEMQATAPAVPVFQPGPAEAVGAGGAAAGAVPTFAFPA